MPQTSFAIMTNIGRAKEAAALANATAISITHIAIGDGATVPSGGETALYHEVARKTISGHGTVVGADNVAYFDCYLAAGDGPYTIREAGLYDAAGDLIAIAHYDPAINKPVPSSGQTVEGTVRLEVAFTNVATVIIVVDPSIQVALQRLTRLPWIPIIELYRNAPPASPVPGDAYVVGPAPTGSWIGSAGKVTEYTLAGWAMIAPPDGHGVSVPDGRVYERIAGTYVEKIALDAQSGKWSYAVDTGTANNLVAALNPTPTALAAGLVVHVKLANAFTGAAVLNLNGLGNAAVVRPDGSAVGGARDGRAGEIVQLKYDGAVWQKTGVIAATLTALPRLPWIPVLELYRNTPPASPAVGDIYVIGLAPTGAWAGNAGKVAEYTILGWAMVTPPDGHGVSVPEGRVYERVAGAYVEKIALDAQSGKWSWSLDTGAVNAIVATLDPAPVDYVAGMVVRVKVAYRNTGPVTARVNALALKPVILPNGLALVGGELPANAIAELSYDGASFQLVAADAVAVVNARKTVLTFTPGSYNWTCPAGVTKVRDKGWGAAGGGGGSAGPSYGGGGGGGGAYFEGQHAVIPGTVYPIVVGAGGPGGANYGDKGGNGGATSFGSLATAPGGAGGGGGWSGSPVGAGGAAGAVATGGQINFPGVVGGSALASGGNGGSPGNSYGQGAGAPPIGGGAGGPGTMPGVGGVGAGGNTFAGGNGGPGLFILEF